MSAIYRIIQQSDRPYEWAKAELTGYFKRPDRFRITRLRELRPPKNVHVSIFHKEGCKPDIWRVYWKDTDSVKYSILANYQELKEQYPDIVAELEKAGEEAYNSEYDRKTRYQAKFGKKVDYQPLNAVVREL